MAASTVRTVTAKLAIFVCAALLALGSACGSSERPSSSGLRRIVWVDVAEPADSSLAGLLGTEEPDHDVWRIVRQLRAAAEDENVAGALLRLDGAFPTRSDAQEIVSALGDLRREGKRVVAYADAYSGSAYLLAAAGADEVLLSPLGMVDLVGVSVQVTHYFDLMEKIGVRADLLRAGNYKTAVEPFTQSEMSPEAREMYDRLLDDLYGQLVDGVASGRKLSGEQVRSLIDGGPYTAREAQTAKLVDDLIYPDELESRIEDVLDEDIEIDEGQPKARQRVGGLRGLLRMLSNAGSGPSTHRSRRDKLALIRVSGVIVAGGSASPLGMGGFCGADDIVDALNEAEDDPTVKAVVLRIDSPGGSAQASDMIWRAVKKTSQAKPVVASMGSVAASGGYYVAMAADEVLASEGTITGSVGVFGGKFSFAGLYDKIGVRKTVLKRGENVTIDDEGAPFSDSERERIQALIDDTYREFVTKAADDREKTFAEMDELAQGKVWTGKEALSHGLVDTVGGLSDAFKTAKERAGYSPDTKFELLELPEPVSLFELLLGGASARADWLGLRAWERAARALDRAALERAWALLPVSIR
ncbi:signal peptide peptidase SppA [Candidatus Poribacteria bacterium]|nr:signal peptide peptidase SppA [Candidatus Poribacteria bacterium]